MGGAVRWPATRVQALALVKRGTERWPLMSSCARILVAVAVCLAFGFRASGPAASSEPDMTNGRLPFQPADLFQLEYASDPQISPDGSQVAYLRNSIDIMTDQVKSRLWL